MDDDWISLRFVSFSVKCHLFVYIIHVKLAHTRLIHMVWDEKKKIVCIFYACMIRESMAAKVNERKFKTKQIKSTHVACFSLMSTFLDESWTVTVIQLAENIGSLSMTVILYSLCSMLYAAFYTQCCCACALFKTNNFDIRFWPKQFNFFFFFLTLAFSFLFHCFLFSSLNSGANFHPNKEQNQLDCNTDP